MPASTTASKSWIKPAILAIVIAGAAAAAYASLNSQKSAPEVTFLGINGEKITPDSLRGKVVMVNFWATSCTTCVAEMPQMVETYNKYKSQGLEFVAVAMKYDPANYVLNYAETRKLPFKVALDVTGDAAKAYGDVALTPTTFVIDKQGKIIKRYVGQPEFASLHTLLEGALKAS
ncbi:TlpA disulfide reductase family protein [Janthinobacterium agaricidamnosum]|uniref:AhpC/TSA family protein n=1 Tax=Janthinobacterium agaricidamnosum NBRC 102515 = DSM 9628 TaxID=1349767 RepID=W0VDR6_9BURK|nr:TlpA disulfide reductase family protein [Janthinobacterium agaricidamnosum]CDG86066.1 ahpC/TSA family protein [Janthinobacterium agaricidamnosum NBRC 102515 = DSM 9628]